MKRLAILLLAVPVFFSAVSYGDISFDTSPYIHPNSPGLAVDHNDSPPDRYILEISQDGRSIYSMWQRFTSLAETSYDPETDNVFVPGYISPRNYRVIKLSSSVDRFDLEELFGGCGWDKGLVCDSTTESFYVNEYNSNIFNQYSINEFDEYAYEKSYDPNSLTSEIYVSILIVLMVFSTIRLRKLGN